MITDADLMKLDREFQKLGREIERSIQEGDLLLMCLQAVRDMAEAGGDDLRSNIIDCIDETRRRIGR